MNITDNLIRIKEGKDNIIKSLKNKGVSINDNTLINEIPTIIDNAEIGGGGGDTPSVPTELVPKYEGASVFRIEVPEDNFKFYLGFNGDSSITCNIDWGDDSEIEENIGTVENFHYYNKGIYDINLWNLNESISLVPLFKGNGIENDSGMNFYNIFTFTYDNSMSSGKLLQGNFGDSQCVTNILIGDNIKSIGNYAFQYCTSLKTVVISEGIKSIGNYCFQNCTSLQSVVIPKGITYIPSYVFYKCSSLQSIVIPEGVTSIANDSFQECRALQSIIIPNTVTSIGNLAFEYCTSLKSVVIPNSVTSIGEKVFQNCTSLKTVVISEGVTSIGDYCFQSCSKLQSITIPDSVTRIGLNAFSGCSSLRNIVIPNSVTNIGSYAFSSCSSLQSVVIPDGVKTISSYTFQNCYALQSIVIPESVTTISQNAFYNCSSLQSVVIPEGVKTIPNYTFQYCYALQSIVIPESVTSIGNNAFSNCYSLQVIDCKGITAPTIQSNTFNNIGTLNNINGIKYLCISENATGYDSDNWKSYVLDKGYTIVNTPYIIPEEIYNIKYTVAKDEYNFPIKYYQFRPTYNRIYKENNKYIIEFKGKLIQFNDYPFKFRLIQTIELPEIIESLPDKQFYHCYFLQSITCKAMQAPTIQSNTFSSIGTNVPSGTPKVLRVPEGATGYDSGNWKSYVLNQGYTLEYFKL